MLKLAACTFALSAALLVPAPAAPASAPRTIVDYYKLMPQEFFEFPKSQRMQWVKNGSGIIDVSNGYMQVPADASQMRLDLALFKKTDGSYLLGVSNDGWDDPEGLGLFEVWSYRNGKWSDVTKSVVPVKINNALVYRVPRYGRTINVNNRKGKTQFQLRWNGRRFVKQAAR